MGEHTKIEWATHTFNPWIGCTKVSPACAHCYAETNTATRTRGVKWGAGQPRYRTAAANWQKPLSWDRAAKALGVRHRVFSASLADWLDDDVPIEWLADLLALIHATPNLDWLLLTKRPENWMDRIAAAMTHLDTQTIGEQRSPVALWLGCWLEMTREQLAKCASAPANVWIGCTVENQECADERIPELLGIPARVRFLSCEPLLGPVDLTAVKWDLGAGYFGDCLSPDHIPHGRVDDAPLIHWVIAGGESGHHARPSHPDWFHALRDQCTAAGVAFFFKQWGEFAPVASTDDDSDAADRAACAADQRLCVMLDVAGKIWFENFHPPDGSWMMERVGKKSAGRLLADREWNDVPSAEGGA